MKIISKFQDYYDIGIAYGIDEKLRFERKRESIDLSIDKLPNSTRVQYQKEGQVYQITCDYSVICFCGKAYPFVRTKVDEIKKINKKLTYKQVDESFSYNFDDVVAIFLSFGQDVRLIQGDYQTLGGYGWCRDTLDKYILRHFNAPYKTYIDLFDDYNVPYFCVELIYRTDRYGHQSECVQATLLPQLKQYKFVKAVPPMQAFQEISMFLGKLGTDEDNTVSIEDKYLVQGKGFDCYSFKMMPKKREKKRC